MGSKMITIAKVVFAIAFIGLLAVLFASLMNKGNNSATKYNDTLTMTDSFDISQYVGDSLTGEAVKNAITNGKSLMGKNKMGIIVVTKEGNTKAGYGYAVNDKTKITTATATGKSGGKFNGSSGVYWDMSTSPSYKPETDMSNAAYINPDATFSGYEVKNDNDVTTGIIFIQDGATLS